MSISSKRNYISGDLCNKHLIVDYLKQNNISDVQQKDKYFQIYTLHI